MINLSKTYKTRGGLDAIIYAVYENQQRPVHGAIETSKGWIIGAWNEDGTCFSTTSFSTFGSGPHDLIERD